MSHTRTEHDSLGEVAVPADALYRAQTQRAVDNFRIGGRSMPEAFLRALGVVKACAADANAELGLLPQDTAKAIERAALSVASGEHLDQFPVDIYQTGSGTSTNMNANEVIASLASRSLESEVHPNDHVNLSQSSNDVVPTTIHVSVETQLERRLSPAIARLCETLNAREKELSHYVKTGRTHLMDAMPITFGQELSAWRAQLTSAAVGIDQVRSQVRKLAQGGTAVGTGVNADPRFGELFCSALTRHTQIAFEPAENKFAAIATQDTAVALSGQLRVLAVVLTKVCNDLRWMNSGPLSGLSEISLKALQPGSSIMPGKVNPVVPESVLMAATKVIGNDSTITLAGQSGNFQLNVMLPLIADNLLESVALLAGSCEALVERCIEDFTIQEENISRNLARNPILATALTARIGYEAAARIAKTAYTEGRAVLDVALEATDIEERELRELLDPHNLV